MVAGIKSDFENEMNKALNEHYSPLYGSAIDGALNAGIELGRLDDKVGLNWLATELESVVSELRNAAAGLHRAGEKRPTLTK